MREDSTDLNRYKAPEKPSIKEQLKEKFPDFFLQEEKSGNFFTSLRSKSPSISLKESLTVKEKALFIKTYHDLIDEKYQDIRFRKNMILETKILGSSKVSDEAYELIFKTFVDKELKVLKELKELDSEVKKILKSSNFQELNQKLYDLDSYKYPTSEIFGQNAICSRKKLIEGKSIAMTGEEFFKFNLLSDLIEQQIKIDKLEKSKTIQEKQLGENATKISLKKAKTDLKQAEEDLEKAREKLKQPKTDLKQAKEDLEKAQKEVAKKYALHMELSALEKIKGNLEKEKITKANIISSINNLYEQKDFQFSAEDLKIFSDSYIRSKYPLKQNPLLLIKNIYDGAEAKTQQSESLKATIDSNANPKLNADFTDLIEQELLKEKLLENLLKNFMKFSEAKGDSKTEFEKSYREDLVKFIKACPSEKERLDVITSFALKLGIPEKNLIVGFYLICANDANAELKDLKGRAENFNDELLKRMIVHTETFQKNYIKNLYELDPDFQIKLEELSTDIKSSKPHTPKVKPKEQPLATSTSLFLGFVPDDYSKFIPSEIKYLIRTPVKFSVRLFNEMQKPDTDIIKAVQTVLSNINESPPKK